MGFERVVKVYDLAFTDPSYKGLEVSMRGLPVGEFLDLAGLADRVQQQGPGAAAQDARKLFTLAAGSLKSWNLEDDGVPVPTTAEALMAQDFDFALALVTAWMTAIAGVSPPLPSSSSNGASTPPPEASLPTEPLSPSLSN